MLKVPTIGAWDYAIAAKAGTPCHRILTLPLMTCLSWLVQKPYLSLTEASMTFGFF
ncbi:MAG: hypothetical protein KME57_26750 [Scytonema hyalinum WJT4-NPBG1]|nr:hypothetical protein [Scytonema hyalinum WJT4-NPBG1]